MGCAGPPHVLWALVTALISGPNGLQDSMANLIWLHRGCSRAVSSHCDKAD